MSVWFGGGTQAAPQPARHRGFPTGIIAVLPLPGEAREVFIEGSTLNGEQQTAYVALGSRGLHFDSCGILPSGVRDVAFFVIGL